MAWSDETWVWFFTSTWKWICKSQKPAKTPTIISTTSGEYYKPDWLLQQFDEWTTRESHQETPVCAKYSCQTSFQSEEIWSHNSCTRYASLASSQILDWIQNAVDHLQRTSWQGTYLHPKNDHPSKGKRYSIRFIEECALNVPKFKHDTSSKRAFAVYGPLPWNCLPKEIRLCDEIEAFKQNLKTHLFVKFVNESTLAIWFWYYKAS